MLTPFFIGQPEAHHNLPFYTVSELELTMKNLVTTGLSVLLLSSVGTAAEWGTVSGRIVLDGDVPKPVLEFPKGGAKKDPAVCSATDVYKNDLVINKDNKGIANVFVFIYRAPKDVHPDSKADARVICDQKACVFKPHAMALQAGQTVEVLNSDPVAHNIRTSSLKNQQQNFVVPANTVEGDGGEIDLPNREIVPFEVKCDFHPHMSAYWLVLDHPYSTTTDKDGKFTIKNLPVGEHEVRIWHERVGYLDRKFKLPVTKGESELKAPIKYTIDQLTE